MMGVRPLGKAPSVTSEQHPLRIAPASTSPGSVDGDAAPSPPQPAVQTRPSRPRTQSLSKNGDAAPERLLVSKKWVLPPRPKPGRKPKPKPDAKTASAKATTASAAAPRSRKRQAESVSEDEPSKHATKASPNSSKADDDSCGLCDRSGGCLCSDIGIKQAPDETAAKTYPGNLAFILDNAVVQPSVPLRQPEPANEQRVPIKKFRRAADTLSPPPAPPPMPTYSELTGREPSQKLEDSCGFCTDNTPCVCAETAQAEAAQAEAAAAAESAKALQSSAVTEQEVIDEEDVASCGECQKSAMSMLFCLSLSSSPSLVHGRVAIPCHKAFLTLQKHPQFDACDLGKLVSVLEVSSGKMVGVQSINRALQSLSRNELSL